MNRIQKIIAPFFSMVTTGVLLVIFFMSIAYATFIENDYGTSTARILIYNARWFEILLLLNAINLTGSIFVNKLIEKKKWTVILFHAAFLIILAGAAITRWTGFEGSIHIREGEQNNVLVTESTYLNVSARQGNDTVLIQKEVMFSPYTANHVKESFQIAGKTVTVENLQFVPSAAESVIEDPEGEPILALLAVDRQSKRFDFLLKKNETKTIETIPFGFMTPGDSTGIRFSERNGSLFLQSYDTLFVTGMDQNELRKLAPHVVYPFSEKTIYQVGTVGFVLKQYVQKGKPQLVYVPSHANAFANDAIRVRIMVGSESKELIVYGKLGSTGKEEKTTIGDLTIGITFGSVMHNLPFMLKLNDFQIERYPGSKSPSSFASEVTLTDTQNNVEKPFRIFMNNILKYKGYRFFQSSFDEDEKGTVLSVNYDAAGTTVTYIGYFLMAIGMILTLFSRKSKFRRLIRASARLSKERNKFFTSVLFISLLFSGVFASAQSGKQPVDLSHARKFGKLLVQNSEGRIEPVNTLASEILRKVAKKGSFEGKEPVQVILDILVAPDKWQDVPFIRVSDSELRKQLGAIGNYISFSQAFENDSAHTYKLTKLVEKAYDKKPAKRNRLDKEIINVDERINIFYKFMSGGFLTIFPVSGDASNKWISPSEAMGQNMHGEPLEAISIYINYIKSLSAAIQTGNYSEPDNFLDQLKENQKKLGAKIYPPVVKTNLEIFYINFNIFSKLAIIYVLLGLLLLVFQFVSLLSAKSHSGMSWKLAFTLVAILFVIHSAGLGIRWVISGHAPWSNGYETLLYISWATCLAGLIFSKRSPMTLSVTTILSAISLFVAGMSWMSPELTNLVPVLKSYWLVIHVAVITASYGFFAVAALLGILNLILMILQSAGNNPRISYTLRELVLIIEMALIVGLFMITIGAFLGGVWANESWGRYWGWDPKETWALVTVLVYAFIVHMDKIPGFRGTYAISFAAVIGFCSVLMTFFGVNYYLSGLHSYAQGEPAPVPPVVYVGGIIVILLSITAWLSYRRQLKKENQEIEPGEV
jgi:cytochrome c-type biogenesis protein CcsB